MHEDLNAVVGHSLPPLAALVLLHIQSVVTVDVTKCTVWRKNFEGEKLCFYRCFRTSGESFLHEILQDPQCACTLHVYVCGCACIAHAREPHLHNTWTGAIREILVLYRNAKVLSLNIFRYTGCFQTPVRLIRVSH